VVAHERAMVVKITVVLLAIFMLQGCCIGCGMSAVAYGGLQVNVVAEDVRKRTEATNAMEPELIETSIEAIATNKVHDAEDAYLHIYEDTSYSDDVRAQALYQIGLMYSVPTHRLYDSERAMSYFEKVMEEFPKADKNLEVSKRIAELQDPQFERARGRYIPSKMLWKDKAEPSKAAPAIEIIDPAEVAPSEPVPTK
jgi:hypothetical protein